MANWTFIRPTTLRARAIFTVCSVELGDGFGGEGVRGQAAGAVAGVHAGLFDVLHDAADVDVLYRRLKRIHVNLDRIGEVAVKEDGGGAGDLDGGRGCSGQAGRRRG